MTPFPLPYHFIDNRTIDAQIGPMFDNIRKSWRLKGRVDDVETTLGTLETRLKRHIDRTAEEVDLLRLEVQRLRGRVVGGVRKQTIEGETDGADPSWEEIDKQIREGTYPG